MCFGLEGKTQVTQMEQKGENITHVPLISLFGTRSIKTCTTSGIASLQPPTNQRILLRKLLMKWV